MRGVECWIKWLGAAGLAGVLGACAGVPHDASLPIDDPNEQFNRGVLHVNQVVLDPAATVVKSVPGVFRDRLQDLDANLKEPRVLGNDILQGRWNAAGITIGRIIFNTTFGIGGLFDVATGGGLPQQTGDFGQTMFVWGVPAGTYVVSPPISVPRRNAILWAEWWIQSAIPSAGLRAEFSLDGRGQSRRALWAPSPISASGNKPRVRRSISTVSCARATIRRAGRNCVRRKACRRRLNRRPRRAWS